MENVQYTDEMDAEYSAPSPSPPPTATSPTPPTTPPPPPAPQMTESSSAEDYNVKSVLTVARQLVNQGRPSQALQAVVAAVRMKGGEDAVIHALNRARELYRRKIDGVLELRKIKGSMVEGRSNIQESAADELASMFAEFAIAEAMPSKSEASDHSMVEQSIDGDINKRSILAEVGREQIVLDAYADGSSFVCLKCGGLVSNQRKEEHFKFWCRKM